MASALLHGVLKTMESGPNSALPTDWMIEPPLVLYKRGDVSDIYQALQALATARRNLVHLFTLCSFVLLIQLCWSLKLEIRLNKGDNPEGGTHWLRKGEWRRNCSAVGFGFLVTGGCLVVKIITASIGKGVWSGKRKGFFLH